MSERLRILRVITRLNVGGPTRHVEILDRELRARGHEVLLACGPAPADEGPGILPYSGERVHLPALCRRPSPWKDARTLRSLRDLVRRFQPDIVHSHQAKAGALARTAAAARPEAKTVHTFHGHTFQGYFPAPIAVFLRWTERRLARKSDALVAQSPSQRDDLARELGQDAAGRIVVIPPAIEPAAFEVPSVHEVEGARDEIGATGGRKVLVCAGRLVPVKRPLLALEILAALADPLVHLAFLGDGPMAAKLARRAAALGVDGRVRFLGSRRDPAPYLRAAHRVLLTSFSEGTPLVLLEALAQGAAVVASDVGGVRDILLGFGILVRPDAPVGEWCRALATPDVPAPDAAARASLAQAASPHRLADDVLRLYSGLRNRPAEPTRGGTR